MMSLPLRADGGCPATGLMFRDSYNCDGPPSDYIPIDAFIPGCPPKPEAVISGVVKVIEGLRQGVLALSDIRDRAPDKRRAMLDLPIHTPN